jgi:hypothetical protein
MFYKVTKTNEESLAYSIGLLYSVRTVQGVVLAFCVNEDAAKLICKTLELSLQNCVKQM